MKKNILVTAAGTGTAFALLSRLRAVWGNGCKVVATDINPRHLTTSALLADRFIQSPSVRDENFFAFIEDVIRNESIDTYIPILNDEFAIAEGIKNKYVSLDVWVNPLAPTLARDKKIASDWLASQSLPVPESFIKADIKAGDEYFVKPANGYGSHSACSMRGKDILGMADGFWSEYIVQEKCNPPEVTVDSFFDTRRDFSIAVARERIETKAGVCTKARVFIDEEISEIAKKLAGALGQDGLICFQMMRVGKNWKITDLNFRPGAGTAITVAAGYDLIAAAFACRWGEPYQAFLGTDLDEKGVYVTRQYAEFVMS